MRRTLAIAVLIAAAMCVAASEPSGEDQGEPTIWLENPDGLSCSPKTLAPNGILVLKLGPGHGKELAIRRESDGTSFFLIVQQPPPDMTLLMSREKFSKASRVEISAAIIGYAWEIDRGNERVFVNPGLYTVHTSDVLESELGGYKCTVTFIGAANAR